MNQGGPKGGFNVQRQLAQYGCTSDQIGCTANVLLINNQTLICANAGDSRCIVAEGGKAINMSIDHKPKFKKEKARIMKAGHRVTPGEGRIDGNLNLSRAIGDLVYKKNPKLPLE